MSLSNPKKPPSELLKHLRAYRWVFIGVGFISMFINLLALVSPIYMMQVYDRVLASRSETTLIMITIAAVGLYVVYACLEAIRSRALVRVGVQMDERLAPRVFDAIFRYSLRMPKSGLHSMQLHSAQPLRDLDSVRQFATGTGLLAFLDVPWIPIFLFTLFLLHPYYAIYSLIAAVVLFGLATFQEYGVRKEIAAATSHSIASMHFVDANLRNNEAVESMGMRPIMFKRWSAKHEKVMALQAQASDWAGSVMASTKFWQGVTQLGILALGAYLVIENQVSAGAIFAANILMGRALAPVSMAVGVWQNFVNTRYAWQRLEQLLTVTPVEEKRMPLPAPTGKISVQNLFVVPPGSTAPVLRGVSFEVESGQMLAVVGPSAAGKSTLVRAIIGVWPAVNGAVRLDGADISSWDRVELGQSVGYLPQDVELFDGTVAENIARLGEVDAGAVIDAAKLAGVHELILQLPAGYDTKIGQGGQTLSGGQRQRIGLARALYRCPPIIVLDEPNSNLDSQGEVALGQAIANLKQRNSTVVIVTHRPNILTSMDKILVLNNGVVDRFGGRDEVLSALMRPVAVPQASGVPAGNSAPLAPSLVPPMAADSKSTATPSA